jgi:hypothetical protein
MDGIEASGGRFSERAVEIGGLDDAMGKSRADRSELLDEMTTVAPSPGRTAEVEDAIEGLIEVGLLIQVDDAFRVPPVSLRAGELELGL